MKKSKRESQAPLARREPPIVFASRNGLANRLRALVGYRALADLLGRPFVVYWPSDRSCPAHFHALFDSRGWEEVAFVSREEVHRLGRAVPGSVYREVDWYQTIWRKHAQDVAAHDAFSERCKSYLRELRPTKDLMARIDEFKDGRDLESAVGVHLRMTDNMSDPTPWLDGSVAGIVQNALFVKYREIIGGILEEKGSVYLCTDNDLALEVLTKEFPRIWYRKVAFSRSAQRTFWLVRKAKRSNIVGLSAKMWLKIVGVGQGWRSTEMGDAVIDLWLLSNCSRLVSTKWSSFGALAAEIGSKQVDYVDLR